MKTLIVFLTASLLTTFASAQIVICFTTGEDQDAASCNHDYCSPFAPFDISKGVYRIPYETGIIVSVTNDHIKHCPRGAIDMSGDIGLEEYNIVAAADGWIRAISDENTEECTCKNGDNCDNNYVWIEHPNGEWTKYVHMQFHSASDLHNEDDWVTAGTVIGLEGTVGCSTGDHCHFEVAMPVDTNTLLFDAGGGWIDYDWAKNLVPLFCGISGHIMQSGESYVALDCSGSCDASLPSSNTTYGAGAFKAFIDDGSLSNAHDLKFEPVSSGVIQGSTSVTLKPGFQAEYLSTFEARIGVCEGAGFNKTVSYPEPTIAIENDAELNPNPVSQITLLQWKMLKEGVVKISVCDMGRHELFRILGPTMTNRGSHQQEVNVSSLASGIYLVVVETDGITHIMKMVVQR